MKNSISNSKLARRGIQLNLKDVLADIDKEESVVRFVTSPGHCSIIDGVDEFYLVIGQFSNEQKFSVKYNVIDGKSVERRWMSEEYLMKSILVDSNRQVSQWVLLGEVIQDPTGIIQFLQGELRSKNSLSHKKNKFIEYARLVRRYAEAKEFLKKGYLLDSLNSIYQSFQHWARLAVLDAGEPPETTLWEQLKKIDPTVYRMYEELATSTEPLDKRIELFLLALDFSMLSKMEGCVPFLLDILSSRKGSWTVEEILDHPSIADRTFDIFLLLEKMAKRSLIKERLILKDGLYEKCYGVF